MKFVTVIVIALSVFLIQEAVAEDWKEIVAKNYKDKILRFAKNMKKYHETEPGADPVCVEQVIKEIDNISDEAVRNIDNCVNSATDRSKAEECATIIENTAVLQIAMISKCK